MFSKSPFFSSPLVGLCAPKRTCVENTDSGWVRMARLGQAPSTQLITTHSGTESSKSTRKVRRRGGGWEGGGWEGVEEGWICKTSEWVWGARAGRGCLTTAGRTHLLWIRVDAQGIIHSEEKPHEEKKTGMEERIAGRISLDWSCLVLCDCVTLCEAEE